MVETRAYIAHSIVEPPTVASFLDKVSLAHELAQLAPDLAALLPSLNIEVLHDFREFNRASFGLEELHDGLDVDDHSILRLLHPGLMALLADCCINSRLRAGRPIESGLNFFLTEVADHALPSFRFSINSM